MKAVNAIGIQFVIRPDKLKNGKYHRERRDNSFCIL